MTWEQALAFFNSPAVVGAAGIVISVFVEYWPWFAGIGSKWKLLVFYVLCFALPVGSVALGLATGVYQPDSFSVLWWPAIYNGFLASGVGTAWHKWVPERVAGLKLRNP